MKIWIVGVLMCAVALAVSGCRREAPGYGYYPMKLGADVETTTPPQRRAP